MDVKSNAISIIKQSGNLEEDIKLSLQNLIEIMPEDFAQEIAREVIKGDRKRITIAKNFLIQINRAYEKYRQSILNISSMTEKQKNKAIEESYKEQNLINDIVTNSPSNYGLI